MPDTVYIRRKITDCSAQNKDFMTLYHIFTETLQPGMPFRFFKAYYQSTTLHHIDVTFIYIQGVLKGFLSAAFYNTVINNTPTVIGRAAIGLCTDSRKGNLPTHLLFAKYMRYKSRHPFKEVILTIYVANPLVYAMICKYTKNVYPRNNNTITDKAVILKNHILNQSGLAEKEISPYVVKIHFNVHLGKDILDRIFSSTNTYVKHYLTINPGFQNQYGVLVIIPVTFSNILHSVYRLAKSSLSKMLTKTIRYHTLKNKTQAYRTR